MIDKHFISRIDIDWKKVPLYSYVYEIESIKGLTQFNFTNNITIFSGENKSGKSTLLEAIAVAYGFNPEGGTLNYRFETFNDVSELNQGLTLSKGYTRPAFGYFFRAESFFNVSSMAEEYEMVYGDEKKALHDQSHGESFISFLKYYSGKGLYILDEPEAALSPKMQIELLRYLEEKARGGSQIIMVTHSPILMAAKGADIWSFEGPVHQCQYEETETYRIMKAFLDDRNTAIDLIEAIDAEKKNRKAKEIEIQELCDDSSDVLKIDDELMDMVYSML